MIRIHCASLALLAAVSVARAGDEASLARLLPPGTPFYLEARNPTPEELEESCMGAALQDPAVRDVLDRLFGENSSFTSGRIPLGPAGLTIAWDMADGGVTVRVKYVDEAGERQFSIQNRFAVAWVGLEPAPFPVDAVAALEVDTDPAEAVVTLQRIVAAGYLAGRMGKGPATVDAAMKRLFREREHGGVTYAAGMIGPVQLHLAPLGRLLVCTTSEKRMRDMIERFQGGARASLASDARFVETVANARGTGTVTTVLTLWTDRAMSALAQSFPGPLAQVRQVMNALGLGGLEGLTMVARVDGRGISSTTRVLVRGERKGLARLFEGGEPAKLECLAFAPKDAVYVTAGNFDVGGLFDIVVDAMGSMGQMGPAMMQAQFQQTFGIKMRDDLLYLLGPEAALIVAPNRGLVPDIGIVFESRDPERLQRSILAMLDRVPWPKGTGPSRFRAGGRTAYAVPLMHEDLIPVPIAPSFGIVDGKLLIAPFPASYQRFVGVKEGRMESILANREFTKLRERVPEDALAVSYLDFPRLYAFLYETGIPILQSMPQHGNSPLFDLPSDSGAFTKHLYGTISWRTADDRGMHWHSHGAVDTSGFMIGAFLGGVGAGLAVTTYRAPARPPVQVAKGPDPRVREARLCRQRVRLIRARIRLYRQEHGGAVPADLGALKAGHVDPRTFLVPGTKDERYRYLGPAGRGGILLHGRPNGVRGRVSVLTTDLEIERLTADDLRRRLER